MTAPWRSGTTPEIASEYDSRYETPGGAQNKVNISQEYLLHLLQLAVTGLSDGSEAAIARYSDPYDITYDWLKGRLDAADQREKNRKEYYVRDYGAKGDGTDDSEAIIQAITAADGAPVFFNTGIYNVSLMDAVSGKVHLSGFGGAIIIGFKYNEPSADPIDITANVSPNNTIFIADGITFQGEVDIPGLTIQNQSQGTFIRSFKIRNCEFYGKIGLVTQNCISSVMENCIFIHNQYGWKSLSCTNISVTDTNFFSPYGVGLDIGRAPDDTANRYGGENIKLTNCSFSDGTTAIKAVNHNYLWLVNCLIDYFNCGIYLQGSSYARLNEVYIGAIKSDRSGYPLYVAPLKYGAVYATGNQTPSRGSGIECINAEFVGYNTLDSDLVVLDGSTTTFSGVGVIEFTNCNFSSSTPLSYLLNINSGVDIIHNGNFYYAPNSTTLIAPWVFINVNRIFSERNNYTNCYKPDSTTIKPLTGVVGNQKYEAGTITLSTDGTGTTNTGTYVFKYGYEDVPKVIATVNNAPINQDLLNVSVLAKDGFQVFVRARTVDGSVMTTGTNNIDIDVIVMGN